MTNIVKKEDIKKISLKNDYLLIQLNNQKLAKLYFKDFSLLKNASIEELKNYSIDDYGFRWENLDEDISFDSLFFEEKYPLKYNK